MLGSINDQYHNLLNYINVNGYEIDNDRTGTGTKKDFGHFMKFEVNPMKFPILSSKYIHFKSIVVELLWMLNGNDNIKYLQDHGISIWDEWADKDGSLNRVYGKQWREWRQHQDGDTNKYYTIDQLTELIETIKNNPNDRRQIVTAWNVGEIRSMNLPSCHHTWQTFVRGDTLDLMMHQRSCDMFLGVPFNLTSYSLLLVILSKITGLKPGIFNWTGGDCHIYSNHIEQAEKQLSRYFNKENNIINFPQLKFHKAVDFTSLETFLQTTLDNPERIYLENYKHLGKIKAEVSK